MDELTLPEPAKGLWRAAGEEMDALLDRLAGAGTRPIYKMGGGTMLAARWKHRKSTDIDLLVPEGCKLSLARENHGDEIRRRMQGIGAQLIMLTDAQFVFEFADGKIDVTEADPRPAGGAERRRCCGFEIDAMSAVQIFRGKLERSLKHEPPARDLLDVIVARRTDPAALEGAVNMLTGDQQRTVLRRWKGAKHRVDREAAETLTGVAPQWRRFTKGLCTQATDDFEDSIHLAARIYRNDNGAVVTTITRSGLRKTEITQRSDRSLEEQIEATGFELSLERTATKRSRGREAPA